MKIKFHALVTASAKIKSDNVFTIDFANLFLFNCF